MRFVIAGPASTSSVAYGSRGSMRHAARNGVSYSRFIAGTKVAGIEVDRKVLADLAVNEPAAFSALVSQAISALDESAAKSAQVG